MLEMVLVDIMSILLTLHTSGDYSCSIAKLADTLG